MLIIIECLIFCLIFTLLVYFMSKKSIATLYNYPPAIQEKVKKLEYYKNIIPNTKNKWFAKISVAICIIIIDSLMLNYINSYTQFVDAFNMDCYKFI